MKANRVVAGLALGAFSFLIPSSKWASRAHFRFTSYHSAQAQAPYVFIVAGREGSSLVPFAVKDFSRMLSNEKDHQVALNQLRDYGVSEISAISSDLLPWEQIQGASSKDEIVQDVFHGGPHIYVYSHLFGFNVYRYEVRAGRLLNPEHRPVMRGIVTILKLTPLLLWLACSVVGLRILDHLSSRKRHRAAHSEEGGH
jgi:hypothetical protein